MRRASLLASSYSATPLEDCASPGCDRFVDGHPLSSLCASHCLPCSTDGCTRRTTPGTNGKCNICLGIAFRPPRPRLSPASGASCAFSIVVCPNSGTLKENIWKCNCMWFLQCNWFPVCFRLFGLCEHAVPTPCQAVCYLYFMLEKRITLCGHIRSWLRKPSCS